MEKLYYGGACVLATIAFVVSMVVGSAAAVVVGCRVIEAYDLLPVAGTFNREFVIWGLTTASFFAVVGLSHVVRVLRAAVKPSPRQRGPHRVRQIEEAEYNPYEAPASL